MATITVNSLVTKASTLIQDATNIRWPAAELVDWLNDGQREIVMFKPEASIANAAMALTASETKQTIPATGIMFLDAVRNLGADGLTPGRSVRVVSRDVLDSQVPTWHSDANALGYIQHYMFDPRDPRHFYVYPKAPATVWNIEIVYSVAPATAVVGGVISIDDIYANAILDYMLYRAYSKDASYAANAQLAAAHYQQFVSGLTGKNQVDAAENPNKIGVSVGNPAVPVKAV